MANEARTRAALDLIRAGRPSQAEAMLRAILEDDPRDATANNNLGVTLKVQGKFADAIACYCHALAIEPGAAASWNNLGNALKLRGDVGAAIASYERAIQLERDHVDGHFNLGTALQQRGETRQAIDVYRRLLAFSPGHANALTNLGIAYRDLGDLQEAVDCYRKAVALEPGAPNTWRCLAHALSDLGQFDEAEAHYRRAVELDPGHAETLAGLGDVLRQLARLGEAIATSRQALAIDPQCVPAHLNLGLSLLGTGAFEEGWKEYEWRLRSDAFAKTREGAPYPSPRWSGESLSGRSILLLHEQGFGDTIQFIRYAPLLAKAHGARVVAGVQPELSRLIRGMAGIEVVTHGEAIFPCDFSVYLLSLPLAFGTTAETIPAGVPYLHANARQVGRWGQRLSGNSQLKVGLTWAGKPSYKHDKRRSLPLAALVPVLEVPGVSFYSLQLGPSAAEVDQLPPSLRPIDWTAELQDFAETAALVANMDLVISVDTAVAHLSGALAKPIWMLSRFQPEWRWLSGRDSSPWYPTMQIFRQTTGNDWAEVLSRVKLALIERVKLHGGCVKN